MSVFGTFDRNKLRKGIADRYLKRMKEHRDIRDVFQMVPTRYHVLINDVPISFLSQALAERQEISDEDLEQLKEFHVSKTELFEMMEMSDPENPPSEDFFPQCVKLLQDIEFLMQRSWGFSEDADFHTWWCKAPHCTCPELDNAERSGTKYRIYREDCPLHGNIEQLSQDQNDKVEEASV